MTRPGLSVPSDAGGRGVSEFAFWAVITLGLRVDVGNMGSGVLETLATMCAAIGSDIFMNS